jgi:hypothetical protein
MTLLRTEWVSLYDRYKKLQYREITRQLDEPTIRIFSAMWKYGPRNLLEVARQTGIPFTSVYHRIARIETKSQEVAALVPPGSKLGLVRIVTLASAAPGSEDKVTTALKAPNLWRSVARCEGNFTHISVQLVPAKYLKEYRSYIQQLVDVGLVKTFSIIYTGDYVPNFPDFDYYDPRETRWKFDWEAWLASLDKNSGFTTDDPQSYQIHTDKKDLMIIWQLEINSKEDLDRFCSIVPRLFFVLGLAKLLRKNAVMVQTWMLESQLPKMFSFFSELARKGLLRSYSAVRIDFASKQGQTISEDLFDDEKGWVVDFAKCSYELQRIEKAEIST